MRKTFFALALMPLLFGAGCSLFGSSIEPRRPATPVPVPPASVPSPSADSSTSTAQVFEDETHSIRVTNMTKGQLVLNGFAVQGEGVGFESMLAWRLEDARKNVIGKGSIRVNQPDADVPGPFGFPVLFDRLPAATTGILFVFEYSAKDGTPIHVVQIPVMLSTATSTVKVYFRSPYLENTKSSSEDCSIVFPVERTIPQADFSNSSAAVQAMLSGPTEKEKAVGMQTEVPSGARLQGLTPYPEASTWVFDFTQALTQGVSDSCQIMGIRFQIAMTALQGESGPTPIVSVDGQRNNVIQSQ